MRFEYPRRLAILFLSALLLSVSLHAQENASETEAESTAPRPVAVKNIVDDQAIQQRLTEILRARDRYSGIKVKVNHGVVTFEGTTASDQDRAWITQLAERTEGVVVVDNQVEVKSSVNLEGSLDVVYASLSTLWRDFLQRLPLLIAASVVILITAVLANLIGNLLTHLLDKRQRLSSSLKDLINRLITIGVWIIGFVVAAVVVFPGMTPAKALTVLGLGSVAIGFAFKDIFENFFAGILILWRYPFDRGDYITCGEVTGRVKTITIRNTIIRRLDGELAVVPNAQLFKSTVDVLTDQNVRRVRIICGVAYGEDVAASREVILNAVHSCSSVRKNRPVEIFANEFADSSINFEVAWWTGPRPTEVRESRDEVVEAIKLALDDAGIEIPFPYRTLTFREPLPLIDDRRRDANEATVEHNQGVDGVSHSQQETSVSPA